MTLTGADSQGTLTATKSHVPNSVTITMETTWRPVLLSETEKPYWKPLQQFVRDERKKYTVFPPDKEVFAALHLTPYEKVSVLILGQDPYHDDGQAHGLCFSVRPEVAIPPSLQNIYKELRDDLGCSIPNNGCLTPWAERSSRPGMASMTSTLSSINNPIARLNFTTASGSNDAFNSRIFATVTLLRSWSPPPS